MKLLSFTLLLMSAACSIGRGQTNPSALAARPLFSLPPSELRPLSSASDTPASCASLKKSDTRVENSVTNTMASLHWDEVGNADHLTLARYPGEFDYQSYRLLHENAVLRRKEPELDDFFSRTVREVFVPEPFRIGKTTVCCSLITAIKRKNPLCLLNPMVLNVSW